MEKDTAGNYSFYLFGVFRYIKSVGVFYDMEDATSFVKPWARWFLIPRKD
jgi:hypothetical protein